MSEFRTHWKKDSSTEDEPPQEKQITTADLHAIVSTEYLRAIANASGGFSFEIKESLGPGDPIGYTDRSRRIYLNPHYIKKFGKDAIRGILTHEAGHHAPPVVEFQNRTIAHIASPEFFPKEIPDDPELRAQLRKAAFFHLTNVLADVWLESFMTRGTRKVSKMAVDSLYHEVGDRKSLKGLSPADQLAQILVGEDRYPGSVAIKDMVAPEVFAEYTALKKSGAIAVMNYNEIFDDPFANEADKKRDLEQKFIAYRDHFFPAWLRLIEKKIQEEKDGDEDSDGEGEGENGEPKPGSGKGSKPWENLSPEDIEKIKKELEKLIQAGKEFQPLAPGTDEETNPQMKADKSIAQGLAEDKERKEAEGKEEKPEPKPSKPEFDLGKRLREFRRGRKRSKEMAQAKEYGVTVETIREYERILRDRADDIESAAAAIAEVFMEDRAMWTEYGKREGDITPGLEYEHISELESGNPSPKTHSRRVRHPDFIETEIEFITDVSGSMSGEPINKSIELQVVLCEAFRRARETLAGLQMLTPNEEEPIRMGATKFETNATRIKKLDDPNSVDAQLFIIENLKHGGGGTNEEEALEGVYGEFKLRKQNVLKIIIVLSDGEGNREAVRRIMAQVEEDNEVVLAAVGLRSSAKSVVDAYTGGLRLDLADRNIYGFEKTDVTSLLPDMLEFLKTQVRARRRGK